jgi:acetyl esterase
MFEAAEKTGFLGNSALFHDSAVPQDTRALNEAIVARLGAAPEIWNFSLPEIRKARAQGRGSFPLHPVDPLARDHLIETVNGPLRLREISPSGGAPRGTYVHVHGGGWVMGTPEENDWHLRAIAEATGLRTISIDYRLAPEAPYPAAPDDCEQAVLALLSAMPDRDHVWTIGGESAGAHLSVVALLRLRDRHGVAPFRAANLVAGCYDLTMTPSVCLWGNSERLILRTKDVENFLARFLPDPALALTPDVSPLRARLSGMPPALFTCGTKDLLLDDSMMMAARWLAAGNHCKLSLYPGGCHVFQGFDTEQARASRTEMEAFLASAI